MLYLRACVMYSWSLWYMLLRYPDGLSLCLPLIHENPKDFTSLALLVICQINFQLYSFIRARGEWNVMHWRSGSRPWTLCSCPWKRCRPSRKLLAKWLSIWIILSVSLIWSLVVMVRPYCHVLIYLKGIHSRPRQFLTRLKYLLSQVNDPVLLLSCPTFEFYPVVSRGCLVIAPHFTNLVKVIPFLCRNHSTGSGLLITEDTV